MRNTAYRALDKNLAIANKSRVSRAHHTLRTAFYRSQYFAPDVQKLCPNHFRYRERRLNETHTYTGSYVKT